MPVEVIMPVLGESIVEGTISKWLKAEGDQVKEDEEIVEVMTDKVNTTLPAPISGILTKILVQEGEIVGVEKPLAVITPANESAAPKVSSPASAPTVANGSSYKPTAPTSSQPVISISSIEGKRYSPVVRNMAKQHGVSQQILASISGTGAGGRVSKRDLEMFLSSNPQGAPAFAETAKESAPAAKKTGDEVVKLAGLRKVIADQMVRSYNIPQVTTVLPIDVTKLMEYRTRNKEGFEKDHGVRLTFTPFFAKAVIEALMEFPNLNARIEGDQITISHHVQLGVAVAIGEKGEGGLIVPVIKNAHEKSLVQIASDLGDIAKRARKNTLGTADIQGGTFTLTNPGSYGASLGTPILNAPQTGILGTYAITSQTVVQDGMIGVRSIMNLVLTYDHRLVDGMYAGRFLQKVKKTLENVEFFK